MSPRVASENTRQEYLDCNSQLCRGPPTNSKPHSSFFCHRPPIHIVQYCALMPSSNTSCEHPCGFSPPQPAINTDSWKFVRHITGRAETGRREALPGARRSLHAYSPSMAYQDVDHKHSRENIVRACRSARAQGGGDDDPKPHSPQ